MRVLDLKDKQNQANHLTPTSRRFKDLLVCRWKAAFRCGVSWGKKEMRFEMEMSGDTQLTFENPHGRDRLSSPIAPREASCLHIRYVGIQWTVLEHF